MFGLFCFSVSSLSGLTEISDQNGWVNNWPGMHIYILSCPVAQICQFVCLFTLHQKLKSNYSPKNVELLQLLLQAFGLHLFEVVTLWCSTDGEERTYGGCEGPDAMYVKLISSDGHEFIVKREHALTSGTIKAMLSGPGEDSGKLVKVWQTDLSSPYVTIINTLMHID